MLFIIVIAFSVLLYHLAKKRIVFLTSYYGVKSRSLPEYYGINIASWNFIISTIVIFVLWLLKHLGYIINYTYGYLIVIAISSNMIIYIFAKLKVRYRAQEHCEKLFSWTLNIATFFSIVITITIFITIFFEAIKFFNIIPIENFILGLKWSPQSSGTIDETIFGVVPILTGTLLIVLIAMIIAIPLGILSAIYLVEYTDKNLRNIIKPLLEILAGVPTIVYGYFAVLVVGPLIRIIGESFGLEVSTESALAAGIVMGMMIIPFVLSLSDDAIASVPQNLREGALALGSTKAEMIIKVIVPAASPGILSGILLAISRAVGETMIVTMAAGINAKLTFNPLDSVSTFTAQIVALLVGDQEFDSPKTLSAFALALALFVITLILNICAMIIIKKKTKIYE
ncbi:MAG: phosphate ABC transporter permease subunit PstC [Pseudomonadota bacterium]